MARPQKQTVDYFPHDTDASDRRTLTIIQNKFGNDGFALWFKLLQLLGKSNGHYYCFKDPGDWEFLLAKTHISDPEIARNILETLATLDAIDKKLFSEHQVIWSQGFVDRLKSVYVKRNEPLPIKPDFTVSVGGNEVSVSENPVSDTDNPQSKVKESKVNNNIYILHEFPNIKLSKEEYDKLIGLFGETGTRDRIKSLSLYMGSTGKAYKSHYLTILNWEERDKKGKNVSTSPAPKGKYDNAVCHNQDDIDQAMKHIRGANREK